MILLFSYLQDILIVLSQNIVDHVIILYIQFLLLNMKILKKKIWLCAFIFSVLYLFPIYSVSLLFFFGTELPVWFYSLFIFLTPPASLLVYLTIKKIFHFSPFRSSIMLQNQLLMHNIIVLIYLILNNAFTSLYGQVRISGVALYLADILSMLVVIIILLIVYFIIRFILKKNNRYIIIPPAYSEKNKNQTILHIFIANSLIYLLVVFYRINWIDSIRNPLSQTTAFSYMLLIITIMVYLLYTLAKSKIKVDEWKMEATDTYISSLLHTNKEFQRVKHDFFNILQVYGGYFETEDYEGVKKYHQSLFQTTKQVSDSLLIIDTFRSRISVYSLLQAMSEKSKKLDVGFSIDSVCDIANIILTDIDLCRILSIVIDNAIEEASQTIDKQVNISFESKYKDTVVFIVSNTTKNDVDVRRIFNDGYTTKGNHTGIGLPVVVKILNSYDQCYFRASYNDKRFTMFLILSCV